MTRRLPLRLLAALVLAATPPAAFAQPRPADAPKQTISADGTEIFQYLLDRAKLQPVKAAELWNLGPSHNLIVIVLGDPSRSKNGGVAPLQLANHVVQNGGAALIAADTHVDFGNAFTSARGGNLGNATIANGSVSGLPRTTKRSSLFLGKDNLPFVVPRDRPRAGAGPEWDVFEGLTRVATNKPSSLSVPFPRAEFGSFLATFPDDCFVETVTFQNANQRNTRVSPIDQDANFFAVGGSGPHPLTGWNYRFLALADPSIFINQMMLADDPDAGRTENLELAARIVGYLSEEDGRQQRTRCVFYQNGELVERFDGLRSMMKPPLPLPNILAMQEKLTDLANKIVDHFETNDVANKAFVGSDEAERNKRYKYIMEFVLAMLVLRAGWYLTKRLWIARRPSDPPSAIPGGLPTASKGERPAGVFDRRQRELLRRNNLFEPVRAIVREMFADAGAPADAGKKLPKVVISDVVARPDTLRDALSDLWKIAYGPARVVTVQRWNALEPLFERVRLARAEGKWQFA